MPQITIDVTFQQRSHRWVLEEGVFFDQLEYEQALAPIARQLDDWMERDEHGQAVVWDSEGRPSAVLDKYLGRLVEEGKSQDVSVAMTEREEMFLSLRVVETPGWLLEPEEPAVVRRPRP